MIPVDLLDDDLHDENVLVTKLDHPITIRLRMLDGSYRYLRTTIVAVIIDYGRSHIIYNGKHFGYDTVDVGVYPDRAYPLYDIFKLLCFTLISAAYGDNPPNNVQDNPDQTVRMINPNLFNSAKALLDYFDPKLQHDPTGAIRSASGYLTTLRPSFYSLPDISAFLKTAPVDFFINGMIPLFGNILNTMITVQPVSPSEVYGCAAKQSCRTLESAIQEYTSLESNELTDPYIFFDLYGSGSDLRNSSSGGSQTVRQVIQNPQTDLMIQARPYVGTYVTRLTNDRLMVQQGINELLPGITLISIQNNPTDPGYLDQYRRFVDRSVKAVDLMTTAKDIDQVLQTIRGAFPDLAREMPQSLGLEPAQESAMNQIIQSIQRDAEFIKNANMRDIVRINPDAMWLFMKLPSLIAAIATV